MLRFPDSLLNETAVLLPYAGVRLTANQYFDNAISLKKAAYRYELLRFTFQLIQIKIKFLCQGCSFKTPPDSVTNRLGVANHCC